MSINPTADSNIPLSEEMMDKSSTSTISLFKDSVYSDATNAFREHLEEEQVQQSILDRCLMIGLQVVQRQDRELLQVAPTLQILLQFGAQWKDGALLEHKMTPYHLICNSTGDHHELLDLMITISGRALIDIKDKENFTPLLYAVQTANINCVRSLISNGANLNITTRNYIVHDTWRGAILNAECSPLVVTLDVLLHKQTQSTIIMTEILDLLLEIGADVNFCNKHHYPSPIKTALSHRNVECIVKLIKKGVQLNSTYYGGTVVWVKAVALGSVEILKCMIENGLDKNCTDQVIGKSVLNWTVSSKSVEAIRYLLNLGVAVPKFTPKSEFKLCSQCEINRLYFDEHTFSVPNPCMQAICINEPNIVQLLEEHGSQCCKSFKAIRSAVLSSSLGTVEYLLSKYTYPLNDEYIANYSDIKTCLVLLTERYYTYNKDKVKITKLLLNHGADPNKKICNGKGSSALIEATSQSHSAIIALFIRNGVDINFRSYDRVHGYVLPFEASILHDRLDVAEMLLVSGCSCGLFSLGNNDMANINSDLKDLMEKWHVQENNVIPLEQKCRRMLLNHLSPQADRKIIKLPLPAGVIRYLSIPELDDILDSCKTSTKDIYDEQL